MGRSATDLVDEAKKRAVLLLICVFGLAYFMSLTSSSVWINMPIAASLIFFLRYVTSDLDIRRRNPVLEKRSASDCVSNKKFVEFAKVRLEDASWKLKINSPAVETAIEHFNRHIISEWVTDLWYSRITPDKDGPEELVQIMNDAVGEISHRARDINLINFLIRDVINLFCNHLELFRMSQSKISHKEFGKLPDDMRDMELRVVMAAENNLHPALFSADAEHKVLQHLMDGLISFILKPKDLQCTFVRYTVRELLACAVMRPILNLANPRIINEKIENIVLSMSKKTGKTVIPTAEGMPASAPNEPSQSPFLQDHSSGGVELVQLTRENLPLKGGDSKGKTDGHYSRGEWGHALDAISARKTQALAPDHLENMWAKGRNYKKKELENGFGQESGRKSAISASSIAQNLQADIYAPVVTSKADFVRRYPATLHEDEYLNHYGAPAQSISGYPVAISYQRKEPQNLEGADTDSESSHATEDDENTNVTGIDSPGTRVWDSQNKTKPANTRIRHPLEITEKKLTKKSSKAHAFHPRATRTTSGRKRYRQSIHKGPILVEDTRSSYLGGDWSDDSDLEELVRENSGMTATSISYISASEAHSLSLMPSKIFAFDYSFLQLRCEVLGANIVKSGSGTFAVYSIGVVDADRNSWSIKRRFRHFEDLHRRLKEFQEYNLSLPPKHFLSSGLEISVVQERCKLLDRYLKNLLMLPTVSRTIEVWDFLSVDSQTYIFVDSLSIVESLSVILDQKLQNKVEKNPKAENRKNPFLSVAENLGHEETDRISLASGNQNLDGLGLKRRNSDQHLPKVSVKNENLHEDLSNLATKLASPSLSQNPINDTIGSNEQMPLSPPETANDCLPLEWVQPNLSVPVFDMVDVIFQLQDGGWIRRQMFWIAKQVLQLGMGDAFDDWLIDKIQLLRKGSVIASVISRLEKILWPDGIFITKHPNRRRPAPQPSLEEVGAKVVVGDQLSYEQQLEVSRRAQFVRELIIDKAPAALVSVIGRKEYERSAQDIYLFLQSSVCMKQFAFELLELLLLAAFPELEDVVRHCHEEKERFGSLQK